MFDIRSNMLTYSVYEIASDPMVDIGVSYAGGCGFTK